jgi:uncharacterized protein (DUF3820 family)
MAVVYLHRRVKDNSIFYVGVGNNSKRAYEYNGRNKQWYEIVNNEPYYVDFLLKNISKEEALQLEQFVIKKCGRIGFEQNGKLVNILGGEKNEKNNIDLLDLNGNIINSFISIKEASEQLNISSDKIKRSIKNKSFTREGYKFIKNYHIDKINYEENIIEEKVINNILNFGKYKGFDIYKVNEINPSYIKWLIKNDFDYIPEYLKTIMIQLTQEN